MLWNVVSDNANSSITCSLLDLQCFVQNCWKLSALRSELWRKQLWNARKLFGVARKTRKSDNNLLINRNNKTAWFTHIRGNLPFYSRWKLKINTRIFGEIYAIEIQESRIDLSVIGLTCPPMTLTNVKQLLTGERSAQQNWYLIFCACFFFATWDLRLSAVLLETRRETCCCRT